MSSPTFITNIRTRIPYMVELLHVRINCIFKPLLLRKERWEGEGRVSKYKQRRVGEREYVFLTVKKMRLFYWPLYQLTHSSADSEIVSLYLLYHV